MITNKHTQTFEDCTVLYIKYKYAFLFNINTNYFYPVIIYTAEWKCVSLCRNWMKCVILMIDRLKRLLRIYGG